MMPLSTTEHAAVQRRTKDARSSGAAVRRAANRQRVSGATVLTATDPAGHTYVLVLCPQKEPGRAYLVVRDKKTGAWICGCFQARWRPPCDHLEAVRLQEAAEVTDA